MRISLVFLLLLLSSCGKEKKIPLYRGAETDYQKFVNQRNLSAPNTNADKTIRNNDYPIEIALYNDHRFYYDLPNLGDGTGTWEFEDGKLHLKAKREIFDMEIDVQGRDPEIQNLAISFTDRFGSQTLEVTNENME